LGEAITLRLLAIPCGLPRDLTELAEILARENPALLARLEYHGMDIDPELLAKAQDFTHNCVIPRTFHLGNALLRESFPSGPFHAIVSTGLNEFLDDSQIAEFFRNIYEALAPGGPSSRVAPSGSRAANSDASVRARHPLSRTGRT